MLHMRISFRTVCDCVLTQHVADLLCV